MRADLPGIVAPTDSPDVKARKLYAAVMKIDNTAFAREHTAEEDRAAGLRAERTAEDVWDRQRGSADDVALTYLALLRAAGVEAYAMRVTDRDRAIFQENFIDTSQLDDLIVIAVLDGKEVFLDPGARFCTFGQLAWQHSWAGGIRQTRDGTALATSGSLDYRNTFEQRIADLAVDTDGNASGTLVLRFTGQQAMLLREAEVDAAPVDTRLHFEQSLRSMLPGGMKLHVISIANLEDGEKPLDVTFAATGQIGTVSGHRLLLSESLLRNDDTSRFASPTRKYPVYFHYPYAAADSVTLHLAPGLKLEAMPAAQKATVLQAFGYNLDASSNGDVLLLKRGEAVGTVIVAPDDYAKMRGFFGDLEAADQNPLLLVRAAAATAGDASAGAR